MSQGSQGSEFCVPGESMATRGAHARLRASGRGRQNPQVREKRPEALEGGPAPGRGPHTPQRQINNSLFNSLNKQARGLREEGLGTRVRGGGSHLLQGNRSQAPHLAQGPMRVARSGPVVRRVLAWRPECSGVHPGPGLRRDSQTTTCEPMGW